MIGRTARAPKLDISQTFESDVSAHLASASYDDALKLCKSRLSDDNADAVALHYAAITLRHLGEPKSALDFHALALRSAPMRPAFHFELGRSFMALRLWADAANAFEIATKLAPANVTMKTALVECMVQSGHPDTLDVLNKMLRSHQFSAALHNLHGTALLSVGRKKEAQNALHTAWKLGNKQGATLFHLVKCSDKDTLDTLDPMFDELFRARAAQSDGLLHFAKAELEHRRENYALAHEYFVIGNTIESQNAEFDAQVESTAEEEMRALFSAPIPTAPLPKASTPKPIFIVGMPRSGSTLCETILAAHSSVTPLGEIGEIVSAVRRLNQLNASCPTDALLHVQESYLASIPAARAQTPWIVDKYLGNFFYLGHILHAFPNAKVLHVYRDARATGWSIYRQCFERGQVGFAYKPEDILAFYDMYTRMMSFWSDRFGARITHLSYDALVENPNQIIPTLIENLGLEWEDACLSPEKVKRTVATASVGQTTQPIYSDSSKVWEHYAPFTDGWLDQLANGDWGNVQSLNQCKL